MTFKYARDLKSGDIIDLVPFLSQYPAWFAEKLERLDHDISAYENAVVENVDDFHKWTTVYTDQHNVDVPKDFKFDVLGNEFDGTTRRAEVAPSMDGGR